MDQRHMSEIYANGMISSRNHCKRTRADNNSENIYENVLIDNLEVTHTQPGPALSVAGGVKRKSRRAAAVFLGLLCLLLLAGLITVVLLFTKSSSEWEMKTVLLQNTNNNLTRETDQLQNERRQREATNDKLMEEKKQLQEKLDSMTKARDDLQRKLRDCHQTTQNNNMTNKMVTQQRVFKKRKFKRRKTDNSSLTNTVVSFSFKNMKMIVHVEDPGNSMVYETISDVAACSNPASKSPGSAESAVTPAATGLKVYRLVGVSFGIICVLHAVLSIALRLSLFSQQNSLAEERDKCTVNLDIEASIKNLTEERDELKRALIVAEASNKNLIGQRDELMQKMNDLVNNLNNGWRYHEDSLYYISTNKKNWQDSRDFCSLRGAQLVIIDSIKEQEFIRSLQKTVWIGLSDAETEGVWKWVDGTPLNQSFWTSGEPNNYRRRKEDCVETKFYNEENSWNDATCDTENDWVCEKKMS
ncbi:C-type lectin domain family 4 member F-like [Parambassis ranga]|uniref:C-type lectin domain family 4 member F-like n=1 Tax=Parambassis ranga TaxID=210632 RepID=A0A6P7JZH5_9TELE|nr:C-type lectin domain family 4 member F-like [Parambassis ranga]